MNHMVPRVPEVPKWWLLDPETPISAGGHLWGNGMLAMGLLDSARIWMGAELRPLSRCSAQEEVQDTAGAVSNLFWARSSPPTSRGAPYTPRPNPEGADHQPVLLECLDQHWHSLLPRTCFTTYSASSTHVPPAIKSSESGCKCAWQKDGIFCEIWKRFQANICYISMLCSSVLF